MSDRVLIWGAGAIGGTVGAYLKRRGVDVTLVDAGPEHVAAINRDGLAISGPIEEFRQGIPAFLPDQVQGVWDRIFLAVKCQHNAAAGRALLPHLATDGYVLCMQNGLSQESVAEMVGGTRTLGGCVNFAGDMLAPGQIRFGQRGKLYVGELDGGVTPRLRDACEMLRLFEPQTEATDDIAACQWGKLCFTMLLIGQALAQSGIVDCLGRPDLFPLWRRLVAEVVAIAGSVGVTPRAFDGINPAAFAPGAPEAAARDCLAALVEITRGGAKSHSGYWRDIAIRKRRSEAEFQLRPVVEAGRRNAIACPALEALLAMLLEVEEGRRPQADDNLPLLRAGLEGGAASPSAA